MFKASYINVRFQYKAAIRVECSERPLSSESGHSARDIDLELPARNGRSQIDEARPIGRVIRKQMHY